MKPKCKALAGKSMRLRLKAGRASTTTLTHTTASDEQRKSAASTPASSPPDAGNASRTQGIAVSAASSQCKSVTMPLSSTLLQNAAVPERTMRGGELPSPSTPRVKIEVLYLFSGPARDNDLTMELVRTGRSMGMEVEVTEVDICHGPDCDLRELAAWELLLQQIRDKKYLVVFMSPPM